VLSMAVRILPFAFLRTSKYGIGKEGVEGRKETKGVALLNEIKWAVLISRRWLVLIL